MRNKLGLSLFLALSLCGSASAAWITGVNGQVRLAGDPANTNYFTTSVATGIDTNNNTEFSGTFTYQGTQFSVAADFQPFSLWANIYVGLTQITNATAPNLIFTFSHYQFNIPQIVGSTYTGNGTPGVFMAPLRLNDNSVELETNQIFLSNGGSYSGSLYVTTDVPAPEPATGAVLAVGLGALLVAGGRLRRA